MLSLILVNVVHKIHLLRRFFGLGTPFTSVLSMHSISLLYLCSTVD